MPEVVEVSFTDKFKWDDHRRALLRAELDGAFFHLYGIDDRDDVDYILGTFPIVNRKSSGSGRSGPGG